MNIVDITTNPHFWEAFAEMFFVSSVLLWLIFTIIWNGYKSVRREAIKAARAMSALRREMCHEDLGRLF